MIDGYLPSRQAAERLGVTRRTLYNLARTSNGFPRPERFGPTLMWKTDLLDEWRKAHPARRRKGEADRT